MDLTSETLLGEGGVPDAPLFVQLLQNSVRRFQTAVADKIPPPGSAETQKPVKLKTSPQKQLHAQRVHILRRAIKDLVILFALSEILWKRFAWQKYAEPE